MTTPLPDDRTERTRTLLIVGIVVLALVVVGLTAWAIFRPKSKPSAPRTFTPAQETTASTLATTIAAETTETSSTMASGSTNATGQGATGSGVAPGGGGGRAAKIAFLLGNGVFVSNEDGTAARQVAAQVDPSAMFSLSPDGATLALVSGTDTKSLQLIDVASGQSVQVPGAIDLPDWSPDSTWVAYTVNNAGSFAIRRVNRDGSGDTLLAARGADAEISPDGGKVAYALDQPPSANESLQVLDLLSNKTQVVPKSTGAVHWEWGPDGSLYFVQPGKNGSFSVGMAVPSLASARTLGSLVASGQAGGPGDLYPSPNGAKVLLTSVGDDGYSRMYLLDVKSGKVTQLATRHDAYPLGWTLDGKHILFVEGNAFQGEATSLYRIDPDGSLRLMVVGGAGI